MEKQLETIPREYKVKGAANMFTCPYNLESWALIFNVYLEAWKKKVVGLNLSDLVDCGPQPR